MQYSSSFQLYNASAGSGKTFTLVKEYLKVILQSPDVFYFQKVLAITFTNKAAGEMKERVMKSLSDVSEGKQNPIIDAVVQEANLNYEIVQLKSGKILNAILQNYAAFSITTIDSFTHKIIKNFAFDLGLSLNFEVEMDSLTLLNEAVDVLISKIGSDEELTKLLIDFSMSKIDEDKSWDVSYELREFSKILLNEDDVPHFRNLSDKTIEDFFALQSKITEANKMIELLFESIADKALRLIRQNGLEFSDFAYAGEVPKHFEKLRKLKFLKQGDLKFEGRIDKNFAADKKLYSAKATAEAKQIIEGLYDDFKRLYLESKNKFQEYSSVYSLNKLTLKSLIPLAVLNSINSELNALKEDNNIRLISEFNQLISDNIKNQPTPFIYERIGQRYMHYFIDEMQDTSVLQWQNLIPLIDNALAQEQSSLLLVGDAKQAIYRWRGGKAEQFIELSNQDNSVFQTAKEVNQLGTNYRSYSEVVRFNNDFFQYVSSFLSNEQYQQLFVEGNEQEENSKKGGLVTLTFLPKEEEKEENDLRFPLKVFEKINTLKNQYALNEIAVLVRKKSDGVAIANFLSENNVPIISSETLLLQNSEKVNFIINLQQFLLQPSNQEVKFEVLYFISKHCQIQQEAHTFFDELIKSNVEAFFESLNTYSISFNVNAYFELPLYEKVEYIIRSFQLLTGSDAYVQFFLDVVLDQQNKGTDVHDFLEYWNLKKNELSIVTSEDANAVHIMTIHKSKGLEFPVVIFPCDLGIYYQNKPKAWFDDVPDSYNGFKELLIDSNNGGDLKHISKRGEEIIEQQTQELELDNFNLLYVALTRAVEQLHIVTDFKVKKNGEEDLKFYSGIFISFLKKIGVWNSEQLSYEFGESLRKSEKETHDKETDEQKRFITTPWQSHKIMLLASASKLWDTEQEASIEYGNLVHAILGEIKHVKDIEAVFRFYEMQRDVADSVLTNVKQLVNQVVQHEKLQHYYSEEVKVINEKEIVTLSNEIIIPDRLVFTEENVVIIDYKTGAESKTHDAQITSYGNELEQLGYKIDKKLLVYINDTVLVKEID